MDRRALHHALEARGGFRIAGPVRRETGEILVEKFGEIGAKLVDIHAAGPQHRRRIGIVDQTKQQMFERGVFVPAIGGEGESSVKRLFEVS